MFIVELAKCVCLIFDSGLIAYEVYALCIKSINRLLNH